ncbi:protein mono-ADP-ribosyltransferase PARP4 isoform X2 [Triplophysa dalaica]|uniref:protein mono-ADP-ribosyltransferase PARP4 isoform X2 n=1 Tax=Triplophysa dalaica TaxID=1582913 RepID=UPI0024DFF3D7|nr:protein mono-ADP-ribosyltransferase PARP4 isoform X2 [Triplophysa dalaica]
MAVFENCIVLLDVKGLPLKEKKKLRLALLDNGGNIAYVINKQTSFVVTNNVDELSSNRQKSIQKLKIPVVGIQYIWSCLDKRHLLPVTEHIVTPLRNPNSEPTFLHHPEVKVSTQIPENESAKDQPQPGTKMFEKGGTRPEKFRVYEEGDHDLPEFPSDFQVAKYLFLEKVNSKMVTVLELQSAKGRMGQQYRVLCYIWRETENKAVRDKVVVCSTSEDAVEAYLMLMKLKKIQGFTQISTIPPEAEHLASYSLKQLLLEERLNCCTLTQEVGVFVELVWTEALGSLSNILTVPVSSISLNDVSRVEGLLLQAQKTEDEAKVKSLLEEVNTLLPLRMADPPSKSKLVSQKLDLCQLIRDILNVSEATLRSPFPSSLGKYRALRCSIDVVPSENPEFTVVSQLLRDKPVQIQQILRVSRGVELQMFMENLGNIKPLLHSTSPSSFVGILSRGLLLPRVGVEQHGIERTDIGNLGGGIYFSDSLMTSVRYSKPSSTNGSRLLLVCEVALGKCKDLLKRDTTLTSAPEGYHSVHGVRRTSKMPSDFEDDEYVVYNTDQIQLKYVVQYTLEEDQLTDFQPHIDTSEEPQPTERACEILSSDDSEGLECTKNPLEEMTAGLLDSSGQTLPLKAVHVRCKLMDLLCQVIVFQTYTNQSVVPIEAKYVFPLEEMAAVCGFEAFINGKHVIGKVKEKEQARKEYRQAIEKGHGAYLMDQDAPDVFTISVGNLPPGATVLIKVTFITELVVKAGSIIFSLPGSVAPWQQSAALNQKTQTTVEKVSVTELQSEGEFSLCMSIEMPYEIINLESSHLIKTKRTDCKAVVSTLPGQTLGPDGLQLTFSLSKIHMPRMWVENHPDKDSQACMLVFYPDFTSSSEDSSSVSDVVIVLDTSESMRGDAMLNARRIALQVLNSLDRSMKINIISFGTDYKEAFPAPMLLADTFESARKFIMSDGVGGSTELWRPLRSLSLLPPSQGMRNILLLSDGHVQNQPLTLQLVRENSRHTRVFTCGLSLTANRHMLRALAQAGGGTYEFFDTKMKHTWAEKVRAQLQRVESPGCRSVAVKWQQFNPSAPPPVQAPSQLHALFSDCHTLVYGFVPHCSQATIFGDLSGQEIKTMVSTTELQKTKGTFLHKLTARAIIRDYEDGILGDSEAEHEGRKAVLKSYITELSKEFSVLSQFTSFVAIEERDQNQLDPGFTDIPKLIQEENVDILPYMRWTQKEQTAEILNEEEGESEEFVGMAFESEFFHDSEDDIECPSIHPSIFLRLSGAGLRGQQSEEGYTGCRQPSLLGGDTEAFPGKPGDMVPPACPRNMSRWPPMKKMSEPPPLAPLDVEEQLNYSELLPSDRASHYIESQMPNLFQPNLNSELVVFDDASEFQILHQSADICDALYEEFTEESMLDIGLSSSLVLIGCSDDTISSARDFISRSPSPPVTQIDSSLPPAASPVVCRDSYFRSAPIIKAPLAPRGFGFSRNMAFSGAAPSANAFAAPPPPPPPPAFSGSAPSANGFAAPPPPPTFSGAAAPDHAYIASRMPPIVGAPHPRPKFGASGPTPVLKSSLCTSSPPVELFEASLMDSTTKDSVKGMIRSRRMRADPPFLPSKMVCAISSQPDLPVSFSFERSSNAALKGLGNFKRSQASQCARQFSGSEIRSPSDNVLTECRAKEYISSTAAVLAFKKIKNKPAMREVYRSPQIAWDELFQLQHEDGYWECTGRLSSFLNLDIDFFANVFLKEKGICSLGVKAHADILRLVATLLVLQLMRVKKLAEGELLQSLFSLKESKGTRPVRWETVKKAVDWACWADRQYPCVCSRLEFGWDWESSTRQLLGCDSPRPYSPLIPVLERRVVY